MQHERRYTMPEFEVVFYDLPNGKEPAKEFLEGLDQKMQAKLIRTVVLLQQNGSALREPYSKPLDNGLFELRAKVGSDISRVLYFFFVGRKIVLTNGFIKKTQKTPRGEIEKANAYRKEYLSRKENRL